MELHYLSQIVPLPDQYFWYILATLLATALIFVIRNYIGKMEKAIEQLVANQIKMNDVLIELKLKQASNERRMDNLENSFIEQLADRIVNKMKTG